MLLCSQCRTHEATAVAETGTLWCERCRQAAVDTGTAPWIYDMALVRAFLDKSWQEPWLGILRWLYSMSPETQALHAAWARALDRAWPPPWETARPWLPPWERGVTEQKDG